MKGGRQMPSKKPMRPSTVAVLLAVILLMLILSNRTQQKTNMGTIALFRESGVLVGTARRPSSTTPFTVSP